MLFNCAGIIVPVILKGNNMYIVVLAGGLSSERDVSLSSGKKIASALRDSGHKVCLLDLFLGMNDLPCDIKDAFTAEDNDTGAVISTEAPDIQSVIAGRKQGLSPKVGSHVIELCRFADITFLALHGGDGENGKVQAFFDMLGIRYTGSSSEGCAVSMHKWISKQLLIGAGIPTPHGIHLKKGETIPDFPLPCVVKPCCGGSSIGISIAHNISEYHNAVSDAFRFEDEILIESYISGRELSVAVLNGKALPVIEIIPKAGFYDYANKYQPGFTAEITPAPISAEATELVQSLAEKTSKALFLSVYCRVDFLLTDAGEAYCLEANTLPGMTPTSLFPQEAAAVGISYPELCEKIIQLSEEKYV